MGSFTCIHHVYIHAHIQTSGTGHLHGMVLSFLMNLDRARQARPSAKCASIPAVHNDRWQH